MVGLHDLHVEFLPNAFSTFEPNGTRDLECFADSSDIPWNPPTLLHSDLTATVQQMSLP